MFHECEKVDRSRCDLVVEVKTPLVGSPQIAEVTVDRRFDQLAGGDVFRFDPGDVIADVRVVTLINCSASQTRER